MHTAQTDGQRKWDTMWERPWQRMGQGAAGGTVRRGRSGMNRTLEGDSRGLVRRKRLRVSGRGNVQVTRYLVSRHAVTLIEALVLRTHASVHCSAMVCQCAVRPRLD